MKAVMLTAMQSGAGKTVLSCAVMAACQKRGLRVAAFKSGPDYIDPTWHRAATGVPGRNLDLILQGEEGIRWSFRSTDADIAVLEGAMGYYDGLNGGTRASTWELADCLNIPAVLAVRPQSSGVTLAAQVQGMLRFRENSHICGILLAMCTEKMFLYLRPILERECGLPVLGYLPLMEEARIESRHLGLRMSHEEENLSERIGKIAERLEQTADLDRLLELAVQVPKEAAAVGTTECDSGTCRIAVAADEAFCFRYEDGVDALRRAGAEVVFFSPLYDTDLPERICGLYLCGGYPELCAETLWKNHKMRSAVREAVLSGMPTVAECGGFLYLQESLENGEGEAFPMCGVLPGTGFQTERLQRFGYLTLAPETDSLLFRAGERVPAHEFHYWDSTEPGTALPAKKADGKSWRCGYSSNSLYAAFPHLHFAGQLPMAERFVRACREYGSGWKP